MKTTFIFLTMALLGFISQQTLIAGPTDLGINEVIEITTCSAQPDPLVSELKDLLTDLGFEIDVLEFEDGVDEESCSFSMTGTYKGEEIDLKITIEGTSCVDLLISLIKAVQT
jgi:hypothetical protein